MKEILVLLPTGGKGTRLKPVTTTLNKSLTPINGRPILFRIIDELYKANYMEFLVLNGHLGYQVQSAILKSNIFTSTNLSIKCELSDPNYSVAQRIIEYKKHILQYKYVMLCYCDNLVEYDSLIRYNQIKSESKLIYSDSKNGNLNLKEKDKSSLTYHPVRSPNYKYSEMGYITLNSKLLIESLLITMDLPNSLNIITSNFGVKGLYVNNFTSVSTLSRYRELRKRRKTIFLDRDGVINANIGKGKYVENLSQVKYLTENINLFRKLSSHYEFDFIVVTNQAGIERGIITESELQIIHQEMHGFLVSQGVSVLAFYYCSHHWDSGCSCRKPKPGLVLRAIDDFGLRAEDCVLIGDMDTDLEAGLAASVFSIKVESNPSIEKLEILKNRILKYFRLL